MDKRSLEVLIGSLAQQQYFFHLLTKLLVEKGVLKNDEIRSRYSESELHSFSHDLLDHLVSTGLKMDENPPSASPKEPPAAVQSEVKEAAGPESDMKS
jgi:hypothetical protein